MLRRSTVDQMSVDVARAHVDRLCRIADADPPDLARVDALSLAGAEGPLPARLYVPRGLASPAPLLLFFHGGGYVTGSLDSHDVPARIFADEGRCLVLSVAYRLAPEHPFPAGPEDVRASYLSTLERAASLGADPTRIAVGGDSAGGNLSTGLARRARDEGLPPPLYQLMIYVGLDRVGSGGSRDALNNGYFLDEDVMKWFRRHYGGNADHPLISPLRASDFGGVAPAIIVTAGFDPLRDDAEIYAERLRDSGVKVEIWCEEPLIHDFLHFAGISKASLSATLRIGRAIRRAFWPDTS
jgi:acetyl esterase